MLHIAMMHFLSLLRPSAGIRCVSAALTIIEAMLEVDQGVCVCVCHVRLFVLSLHGKSQALACCCLYCRNSIVNQFSPR